MKGNKKKIELNNKEKDYLSGLLEAQKCRIALLDEKQQERKMVQEDLKIAEKIERKLAFE